MLCNAVELGAVGSQMVIGQHDHVIEPGHLAPDFAVPLRKRLGLLLSRHVGHGHRQPVPDGLLLV